MRRGASYGATSLINIRTLKKMPSPPQSSSSLLLLKILNEHEKTRVSTVASSISESSTTIMSQTQQNAAITTDIPDLYETLSNNYIAVAPNDLACPSNTAIKPRAPHFYMTSHVHNAAPAGATNLSEQRSYDGNQINDSVVRKRQKVRDPPVPSNVPHDNVPQTNAAFPQQPRVTVINQPQYNTLRFTHRLAPGLTAVTYNQQHVKSPVQSRRRSQVAVPKTLRPIRCKTPPGLPPLIPAPRKIVRAPIQTLSSVLSCNTVENHITNVQKPVCMPT